VPIQTCFESETELALLLRLCPSLAPEALSFSNWLNRTNPVPLPSQRWELASTFTKTHLPANEWLSTLEWLRQALVLTPEQVTFCFSQLPSTRKNRSLRECFLFYLNSPLSQDFMSQVWTLIEKLKSPGLEKPNLTSIDFIPTEPSGYLFQELVRTALSQGTAIRSLSFSEMGNTPDIGPALLKLGSRVSALETFGHHLALYAKENPEQQILVSFCGSSQSKAFLRSYLASSGLRAEEFLTPALPTESFWSRMLRNVRRQGFLRSEDTLRLNSLLLEHPPYEEEAEEDYKERLLSTTRFNSQDLNSLLAAQTQQVSSEQLEKPRILITPFLSLPLIPGYTEFSFVDESLLERPENQTLFSESELETLFFAGFQLPRWSETLKSRLKLLSGKAGSLQGQVYACLPLEHLEAFELETVKPPRVVSASVDPSYQAPLPVTTLSATQLETYAECPSKYLYRRFKLNQVPMPMSDFALHLGQAVHLTLETLFSSRDGASLDSTTLRSAFEESLKKTLPQHSHQENLLLFFKKAFEKMVPRILELEKSLQALFGARATVAVEKEFKIEVDGLSIVGKIDRVDRLPNDSLLVLDYKTGTVDFTPDHLAQGYNFQALLYWLGAEQSLGMPPAAMLFYDLKKGEIKRGLASEELILPEAKRSLTRGHAMSSEKLISLIESGKTAMRNHAKGIKSGQFPPTPSLEACRFCEATGFCREGAENV